MRDIVWRDGVHVVGTPLWIDARRARDVCFATSADRVSRAGHGQLLATPATLAQLEAPLHPLPLAPRRPLTLGRLRLEAFPTGHCLGGAGLLIDNSVAVVGGFVPTPAVGEPGELRPCETLVLEVAIADARPVPTPSDAADETVRWLTQHRAAHLVVPTLGRAIDVALALEARGVAIRASAAIRAIAQRLANANCPAPALTGGTHLLEIARARPRQFSGPSVWLSHRTEDAQQHGCDAAIGWAAAVHHGALVRAAQSTGARRIFLTGPGARTLAPTLNAHVLAPPRQMALFG